MTQAAEDLLVLPAVRGTVFEKVHELERQVTAAQLGDLEISALDTVTEDLGLIEEGEYRVGNDKVPGDGFTGVRIGGPFWYLDHWWHIVGLYMDVLKFALSAEDGAAYAAGGYLRIDQAGLHMLALDYPIDFTATNNSLTRTAALRLHALTETAAPRFEINYAPPGGENLVTNGGFETGDLSNWTVYTGSWAASTENPESGTYSARGEITSGEAYLYSDRIGVTEGYKYEFSAYMTASQGVKYPKIVLKFYDAASGGNLVGRFFYYALDGSSALVDAPEDALSVSVDISFQYDTGDAAVAYFDDISLALIEGATTIALDPAFKLETADAMQLQELSETPTTPDTGYSGMYFEDDGLYLIDDEGNVVKIGGGKGLSGTGVHIMPAAEYMFDYTSATMVANDDEVRCARFLIPTAMELRYLSFYRLDTYDDIAFGLYNQDGTDILMQWVDTGSSTGTIRLDNSAAAAIIINPGCYWFAWGCYDASDRTRVWDVKSQIRAIINDGTVTHFGVSDQEVPAAPAPPGMPSTLGTITAWTTLDAIPIAKIEGSA